MVVFSHQLSRVNNASKNVKIRSAFHFLQDFMSLESNNWTWPFSNLFEIFLISRIYMTFKEIRRDKGVMQYPLQPNALKRFAWNEYGINPQPKSCYWFAWDQTAGCSAIHVNNCGRTDNGQQWLVYTKSIPSGPTA